ncbi:MAG: UDP-N-acetylmuramate dehydrogenase [Bacteroidota bacterium]
MELPVREHVPLAPLTTIALGGTARYLLRCDSTAVLREGLAYARRRGLPSLILGGGSNILFGDGEYPGLVLQMAIRGIKKEETGRTAALRAAAGENWDPLVRTAVEEGLAGLECLSGIPGLAGATPIQNVGAYGQEVSDTIASVEVLDRKTLEGRVLGARECRFGYRSSTFKEEDAGRFAVTAVTFRLERGGPSPIRYPELAAALEARGTAAHADLRTVRETVLELRRAKSMLEDPEDPHARSLGSFFLNPVLSRGELAALEERSKQQGISAPVPSFAASGGVKVPAAWLVEHAGFPKGTRREGAGVSARHALALVNYGTTSAGLLRLAEEIETAVRERFDITLVREPVIIGGGQDQG